MNTKISRRRLLKTTAVAATVPYFATGRQTIADQAKSAEKNDRPLLGAIGIGGQGRHDSRRAKEFGDFVAVCDVDRAHAERANQELAAGKAQLYGDYRKLLERKDVEAVIIATPDHWHTKIAIEAMQAGKDVYCEKPLTLTIEEGKLINQVQNETGRVFQVGTQQRTEMGQRFLQAIAMIRDGRIGDVQKMTVNIGGAPTCGAIPVTEVPSGLNWEKWLGQAPLVDYRRKGKNTRCHYEFRWWYEYSGGKLTDWGAHHVDIAMLALDKLGDDIGYVKIEPVSVTHPVPFVAGMPTKDDRFNAATEFNVRVTFDDGVEMHVRHEAEDLGFDNGIMFQGSRGRYLVNRGKLVGKPVELLEDNPLPRDAFETLYGQPKPESHMANFIECVKTREQPISDVSSHNAMLNVCHAINIAMRLDRTLTYDPKSRKFIGDDEANTFVGRQRRDGYDIVV